MTFYVKMRDFCSFLEVQSQIIVDLLFYNGGSTAMFDKDRVDYKGEHPASTFNEERQKTAGVIGNPQDDNRLRMRRIAIHFDSCKTRGKLFENKQICQLNREKCNM